MRRKEPFIARMMLLSELKADNDSVIMAHCEYLSWKDLGKMNRHCWFVKTEQLVFGLQKHSELSTTFLFKIFPETRYFFESYIERHHCKKFLKWWSACLIFTPEIDSLGSVLVPETFKTFTCFFFTHLFNFVGRRNTFKEHSRTEQWRKILNIKPRVSDCEESEVICILFLRFPVHPQEPCSWVSTYRGFSPH